MISIDEAVKIIREGKIVAFPTETVYGLGGDAWNPSAIKQVFKIKDRPADNPLIVHVATTGMVKNFAVKIPPVARKLAKIFWPGPLTLIFQKKTEVLDLITAGLDSVALRWPNHPISQELIYRAGPLVAPSANTSGRPSPTKAKHVKEDFGEDFPIIDSGSTQIGLESTVLDITAKPFQILRPGYIGKKEIEKVIDEEIEIEDSTDSKRARSPGTRYSHYTPNASVEWLADRTGKNIENSLFLLHRRDFDKLSDNSIHYHGDYEQFAKELFDRFREADHQALSHIYIEPFDELSLEKGIVQALYNRIEKAIG